MATRILVVDDSPTIRLVVASILAKSGYEPEVAVDGQDAYDVLSSGKVKADLVLVDFVMPRMNGFQFCRALRADEALATTPVVLMSAKGDRIRDQFVQQTGAVDAITKPFDAQALVVVIENALRKVNTNRISTREFDAAFDDVTRIGPAVEVQVPAFVEETRRTHVAQIVAQKLARIVSTTVLSRPNLATASEIEAALAVGLSNEAIIEMMEVIRAIGPKTEGPALAGDLGVVPIGAVLQLLQAENQTGVLVCTNGDAEIRATFRGGAIDLVQSTGAGDEFRLGRFFIDEGILSEEEIDALDRPASMLDSSDTKIGDEIPRSTVQMRDAAQLEWSRIASDAPTDVGLDDQPAQTLRGNSPMDALDEPKPLGMRLVAAEKISEAQLKTALTRQSSELLYEVLRWPTGRFELRREPPSELAENAKLGMPVASVVMEGFRRVDEWRVLEGSLGSFDAVLVREDDAFGALDIGSLPARERAVLYVVDGERTVRGVVAASHLSSFDACRILVQFLEARVLRRRVS